MNEKQLFWKQMWTLWYSQQYDLLVIPLGFCALLIVLGCYVQASVLVTIHQRNEYIAPHYSKIYPCYQLNMRFKNQQGSVASDFEFSASKGRKT